MKVWMVFELVDDFCNTRKYLVDVYKREGTATTMAGHLNRLNNDPMLEYIVEGWEVKK